MDAGWRSTQTARPASFSAGRGPAARAPFVPPNPTNAYRANPTPEILGNVCGFGFTDAEGPVAMWPRKGTSYSRLIGQFVLAAMEDTNAICVSASVLGNAMNRNVKPM